MILHAMTGNKVEIEIKARIDSIGAMEDRIKKAGGTFKCNLVHEDYYFDRPPKLGSFASTDEALRLRLSRDETNGIEKQFITYKGKKLDGETKTREEIEVPVGDIDAMRRLLVALGYVEAIVVRKVRKLFEAGDIEVLLDKVEHLDTPFIEVEIIGKREDVPRITERLFAYLEQLGIPRDRSERKSYLELIMAALASRPR